jgi:hypothetical protein
MSWLAAKGNNAVKGGDSRSKKTTTLNDADRADRLLRMRSKTSKDGKAANMPRPEVQDAAKLVRTRLNADETASLRAAFSMFASATDAEKLKAKKLWSVLRALGLAPTPLEFEKLAKEMDKKETGVIKWVDFMKVRVNTPAPSPLPSAPSFIRAFFFSRLPAFLDHPVVQHVFGPACALTFRPSPSRRKWSGSQPSISASRTTWSARSRRSASSRATTAWAQ